MSNVIQFPHYVAIEITAGTVTGCTIHDADGVRSVPEAAGQYRYFVDVIEADGGRICMWSGGHRADAQREAEECRRGFGGQIRDLTGEAA